MSMMRVLGILAAGIAATAKFDVGAMFSGRRVWRGGTPSSGRGLREKTYLPSGYPGAKLARKAQQGRVTLRW